MLTHTRPVNQSHTTARGKYLRRTLMSKRRMQEAVEHFQQRGSNAQDALSSDLRTARVAECVDLAIIQREVARRFERANPKTEWYDDAAWDNFVTRRDQDDDWQG